MAFTYGFYNSVNHDRKYDAVQMGQIFDGIITDGIYATYLKAMVVKASSNASEVIVQPGRAWFNHTWSYNDADFPVAAPEPEVVLDRIDTLVLDINAEDASRTNSYLWVQGTPTSQIPEPPALIHTATHNQYPLCDVYRQAGTTQIYAADITNRVGTSDCPFVTGVLEGIDIDDLLAQWDNEFHTWENATKASFEGWMVNQQAVYTAWWDALKVQMAGDVADVEAWIATIHDILDEEVATRLQAEIDEIKTELPSGSHITVTTTDTELYSRTVTITDEANHTVTSQFDATGVAVFKTVPYVGNLTISSTDGTRTATSVVQTPYFARYQFAIAFWNATVNIDGTSELGGATVSITDSSLALVGTVVLNASGLGVFNATYPDTYKFSVTHGGETMSVTLEVSQETTYNVEIHGGFNWQRWVDLSENYSSSDFDDLDELLADQKAVRELMTIHACVDYMAEATRADANITQIINDDICAKWINNRDYALDTLYANSAIAAVMDTVDKYFYGEWGITDDTTTPATWGPKGNIPVMTSDSAPYGSAFSSGANSGFGAYKAFDGDITTRFASSTTTANIGHVGYKFANPIMPKSCSLIIFNQSGAAATISGVIEGSNDGTNYDSIGTFQTETLAHGTYGEATVTISTSNYYLYLRVRRTLGGDRFCVQTLQFYGRQLSVSVPVMTSNTAPYGVVSASSEYSSDYAAWKAFNGVDNGNGWCKATSASFVGQYVKYDFNKRVNIKQVSAYRSRSAGTLAINEVLGIEGSNDDVTYTEIGKLTEENLNTKYFATVNENNAEYRYIRAVVKSNPNNVEGSGLHLQFYGLDYSEKEFEAGTTKKWLYDHGVELVEMATYASNSSCIAEKESDDIHIKTVSNKSAGAFNNSSIDLSNYNLVRAKFEPLAALSSGIVAVLEVSASRLASTSWTAIASAALKADSKDNAGLDASNVTQVAYIGLWNQSASGGAEFNVKELWVEQ